MGSMMSKQRTADYAFFVANFAFEIAREFDNPDHDRAHYRESFQQALALVRHSNHILALAEEAETLNRADAGAVTDFDANWRMALNWWNQMIVTFTDLQDLDTQKRMREHFEGFWAKTV